MAHIRKDSSKPSTTISLEQALLDLIEDYRFTKRKNNRSEAIADLIQKGLKLEELLEKKKAKKKLEKVPC
ncbi:ribbon-helix-helix domain-containing protein [Bacillus sp. MCCB 382]|uniref:ribbon-helix-helix domain-containing protein n=1 Tax=Bacillus sp. MCCB 382 TaxID=2860197 RepID=UPI001C58F33F|nr:ribbon-helix-helix domain-containing protein [Bacillus sp. MCCB 382]